MRCRSTPYPSMSSIWTGLLAILFSAPLWALPATAMETLDQRQETFSSIGSVYALGGEVEQRLAQTVTVGISGRLSRVEAPIGCTEGELLLEIRNLRADGAPGDTVLHSQTYPAEDFPAEAPLGAWSTLVLTDGPSFTRGQRFALVLDNPTGSCDLIGAGTGDLYPRGNAYFQALPTPIDWLAFIVAPTAENDLAFRTYMTQPRAAREPLCRVPTGLAPPLGQIFISTPICGCLSNRTLLEFQCRLIHPDFFAVVRVPEIVAPGEVFTVTWTVLPVNDLSRPVEIRSRWPQGFVFDDSILDFSNAQPAGSAVTLTTEVQAPQTPGKYSFRSQVRYLDQPTNRDPGRVILRGGVVEVRQE
ncbi:MAG: hypothetical protein AAGD01_08300 [Acidobacteriota bacterium]